MNFAEKFCAQHNLAPEKFESEVFRRALHNRARLLWPLLALIPGYFAADREFVRGVGRISRLREFEGEAIDFNHDPANRGVMRQWLRFRVSTRRLRRLVRATLHDDDAGDSKPRA